MTAVQRYAQVDDSTERLPRKVLAEFLPVFVNLDRWCSRLPTPRLMLSNALFVERSDVLHGTLPRDPEVRTTL